MKKNIETARSLMAKERQLGNVIKYCEHAIETEQISVVPLSELKIPDYYCRIDRNEVEDLWLESITERGQIVPLIVNCNSKRSKVILDGVARLEVLQKIGKTTAKVIFIDVSADEEIRVAEELNLKFRVTPKLFLEENGLEDLMIGVINEAEQKEKNRVKVLSDVHLNSKLIKEDIEPVPYKTSTSIKLFLQERKVKWKMKNLSQVIDSIIEKYKEYENTEI